MCYAEVLELLIFCCCSCLE